MIPIKTYYDGESITKTVVDDIYRLVNRLSKMNEDCFEKTNDALASIHKDYDGFTGELIVATGNSKPRKDDVYDQKIGEEIAFKKAKLKLNLKRLKLLKHIRNEYVKAVNKLDDEANKIIPVLSMDMNDLSKYNPDFDLEL